MEGNCATTLMFDPKRQIEEMHRDQAWKQLNPGVKQRMYFIDSVVDCMGQINRALIMDYFGLSMPQASIDLRTYRRFAPENLQYDLSGKTYRKTDKFKRIGL